MRALSIVADTNFFVGLLETSRSLDEVIELLELLRLSFTENMVEMVIPSRVLAETERFNVNLARYLELNFNIRESINVNQHPFFVNLKHANSRRVSDQRWFNTGEITDLEVMTVARDLLDEHASDEDITISILTNDEGIERATAAYMKGVKTWDAATFLGHMLGLSNDAGTRRLVEDASKRMFRYHTRFRVRGGRPAVSQIDNFFSEMLNAIRLAREDARGYFDERVTSDFDRFLVLGKHLEGIYGVFEPSLETLKRILTSPSGTLVDDLDARLDELFLELNDLASRLNEPTNYTRFYNYISMYLLRIFLAAFKEAFFHHDLDKARAYLAMAKLKAQALLHNPSMKRIYFSIIMVETVFSIVSGTGRAARFVSFLGNAARDGTIPPLVSEDLVNLLLAVHQCTVDGEIVVPRDGGSGCEQVGDKFSCAGDYLPTLLQLVEEFSDEVAFFGRHELAVKVLDRFVDFTPPGSDDRERISSKIFLHCLMTGQDVPARAGEAGRGARELTTDPLPPDLVHDRFVPVQEAGEAFTKRFKVLAYVDDGSLLCWVYPLWSRFTVLSPPGEPIDNVHRLKEFKILDGTIMVTPHARPGTRGTVEIGPGSIIKPYHYQDRFFTLNVL